MQRTMLRCLGYRCGAVGFGGLAAVGLPLLMLAGRPALAVTAGGLALAVAWLAELEGREAARRAQGRG